MVVYPEVYQGVSVNVGILNIHTFILIPTRQLSASITSLELKTFVAIQIVGTHMDLGVIPSTPMYAGSIVMYRFVVRHLLYYG